MCAKGQEHGGQISVMFSMEETMRKTKGGDNTLISQACQCQGSVGYTTDISLKQAQFPLWVFWLMRIF